MEGRIQERNVKTLIYCANEAFRLAKEHRFTFFFPPYRDTQALMNLHFVPLFYEAAVVLFGEEYVQKELRECFNYRHKDVTKFRKAYARHLEKFPDKETPLAIAAAHEALDILSEALMAPHR